MPDAHHALTFVRTHGPAIAREAAVNLLLPFVIYSYAAPLWGEVEGLLASSAPPIVWSVVEFIRHRKVDVISTVVLAGIVLSVLAFFGGGGARMLQLREKLVTGVFGLVFLASAAINRPLIYEFAKAGSMRRGSADAERLVRLRDDRLFRRSMTIMTVVWGFALILDVAIGAALIFLLSIPQYLLVGPIEGYVFMGALGLWTFWYSKHSRRRNDAVRGSVATTAE